MQALGDTVIIGLFEATPQIRAPITAQGKPFLAHGNSHYLRIMSHVPDRGSACKTEQISFRSLSVGRLFWHGFPSGIMDMLCYLIMDMYNIPCDCYSR